MTPRLPVEPVRPDVSALGLFEYAAVAVLVGLIAWFGAGWAVAVGLSS